MALQDPTTTTTAVSQSTQSSDVNTSPVGSPPIILAFLAIGIFFAAMIAVCGWRRVHFGRDVPPWGRMVGMRTTRFDDFTNTGLLRSGAGGLTGDSKLERPRLWEVWADRKAKPDGVDYGFWDNLMPLAVLPARPSDTALTPDQSPPTPPPQQPPLSEPLIFSPPSSANTQSPPSRRRHRLDDLIPLALLRRHAHSDAEDPSSDPNASGKGVDKGEALKEAAQVVVIIEMPSLTSPRHRQHLHETHSYQGHGHQHYSSVSDSLSKSETLVETHDRMREELLGTEGGYFNYSLGVHMCRWPVPVSTKPDEC